VVYAWPDHPAGRFKGGWIHAQANVLAGRRLQWGREPKFTFEMAADRKSIEGEWEKDGVVSLITMKKVGP